MTTLKQLCIVVVISLVLGCVFSAPAAAITAKQWEIVCSNNWGLRSATSPQDDDGAGYGMDNGEFNCYKTPAGWDRILRQTIALIKDIRDSDDRVLLVIGECTGTTADYGGAFPKCHNRKRPVISASREMRHYSVEQLVDWVMQQIPNG